MRFSANKPMPEPEVGAFGASPSQAAPDVLGVIARASAALLGADDAAGVLRALLPAAADLGAARPRAGLWRPDENSYAMWQLDAGGEPVACGSAPASVYMVLPAAEESTGPVVPLAGKGRRWGVLDLGAPITPGAGTALGILIRQAVARLESASGASLSADEDLLSVMEGWWSAPDTERLLGTVLSDVARLTGADSAALTLVDPQTGVARTLFSEDLKFGDSGSGIRDSGSDPKPNPESRIPDPVVPNPSQSAVNPVHSEALPWKDLKDARRNSEALLNVLRTGDPMAFRWNPTTEALKIGILPSGPAEGSFVAQAMKDGGDVVGVLHIFSARPKRFGPAHDAALCHAARTLARVLGQRERALTRKEVDRQRDEVIGLASALASENDLKQVAGVLTRASRNVWADADIIYTMLPQVEGGLWSIAALDSVRPEDNRHGWARAGEGFPGWVIQTKQALSVSSAADDPRRGSLDRGQDVRSGIWAPMKRGETLLGLMAVACSRPGRTFGPEDLETLERLAEQGAVALERARERHSTQAAFWDAIEAIAGTIDARDGYTHGHSRNVTDYALAIARAVGLPANEIQNLRAAALMHDIGKIGIPDHILNKPGQLSPDERTIMESHPEVGYEILLRAPSLQSLLPGVRYHHERFDGQGYPAGIRGADIPLQARIIGVADAFDAMTSDRVYRKRMTVEKAVSILREGRGIQWDPQCVDAFLAIVEERATPRLQMLAAEDSGRQYLPSLGTDVFGS